MRTFLGEDVGGLEKLSHQIFEEYLSWIRQKTTTAFVFPTLKCRAKRHTERDGNKCWPPVGTISTELGQTWAMTGYERDTISSEGSLPYCLDMSFYKKIWICKYIIYIYICLHKLNINLFGLFMHVPSCHNTFRYILCQLRLFPKHGRFTTPKVPWNEILWWSGMRTLPKNLSIIGPCPNN